MGLTVAPAGVAERRVNRVNPLLLTLSGEELTYWKRQLGSYHAVCAADSPVGAWPLSELSGSAIDISGNGNDGTVTGATQGQAPLLTRQGGASVEFDGAAGEVDVPDDAAILDIFGDGGTIECWVDLDSDGEASRGRLWGKREAGAAATRGYYIETREESGGQSKLRLFRDFNGGTDGQWTTTDRVLTNGAKHHVAVAYDDSAVANDPVIYVDGVAVDVTEDTTPVGDAETDGGRPFVIGNRDDGATTLDGHLSEVRLYNAILTAGRVTAHYIAGTLGDAGGDRATGLALRGTGIHRAATNLVTNSQLMTATAGWSTQAAANTISRVKLADEGQPNGPNGETHALKIVHDVDSGTNNVAIWLATITAAIHSAALAVLVPTAVSGITTCTFRALSFTSGTEDTTGNTYNLAARDTWQELHVQMTPDAGDLAGSFTLRADNVGITVGPTSAIYVTGLMLSASPDFVPLVATDGLTATRAASVVTVDAEPLDDNQMWWIARVNPNWDATGTLANTLLYVAHWGTAGGTEIVLFYRDASNAWRFFVTDGAGDDTATSNAQAFSAGDGVTVAGFLNPTLVGCAADGAAFNTVARGESPDLSGQATWTIGRQRNAANRWFDGRFLWFAEGVGLLGDVPWGQINATGDAGPGSLANLRATHPDIDARYYWDALTDRAEQWAA